MDFRMKKFLPILLALFLFLPGPVFAQSVVDVSVTNGLDDVNHHLTPIHVFSTGFGFVQAGDFASNQYDWESGIRFLNIPIDQGGTISSAFLKLQAQGFWGTGWKTLVKGQDVDTACAVSDHTLCYDAVARTSNTVVWNPTVWTADVVYTSPDLVLIIQEIIDRPGWVSGNDLGLFWTDGQGAGWQTQKALRGDSFEGTGAPPELIITWIPIPPVTPTSIFEGWIAFVGNGLAILIVAFVCGIFLWLVKAPPLMMLICGWLSLLLLFTLGIISPAIVLIALVAFIGAIFFKIVLGTGESA
ncbi:MAG: hypothetical protein FVQ79_07435 [Planctomycetes bacterium]|nr:hypothetical protein [Planctomycetota bacterium]